MKALIEYKSEDASIDFFFPNPIGMHPKSYEALNDLANRGNMPFFVVIYKNDFTLWLVTPMNDQSKNWFKEATVLSEKAWVLFLYTLRGRTIPQEILKMLR